MEKSPSAMNGSTRSRRQNCTRPSRFESVSPSSSSRLVSRVQRPSGNPFSAASPAPAPAILDEQGLRLLDAPALRFQVLFELLQHAGDVAQAGVVLGLLREDAF